MALKVAETSIEGCWTVKNDVFRDDRGTFLETWNSKDFSEVGLPIKWPQDNVSVSHRTVMRGLHIQRRKPQGKLVRCLRGSILDVCLDLRDDSPTFKRMHIEILQKGQGLYLPPGTAHGFLALSNQSVVYYKCTTLYDKNSDGGVNFMSVDQQIMGGLNGTFIMSPKDMGLPMLEDWLDDPRGLTYE